MVKLDGDIWEEVPRPDFPKGIHIYVVRNTMDDSTYGHVALANDDKSVIVPTMSFTSGMLLAAQRSAAERQLKPSELEEFGISADEVAKLAPPKEAFVTPPPTQRLLVERYGKNAIVKIECSGWANYLDDENNGDPWSYDFEFRTGSWDDQCYELSEFTEYEIEGPWGVFDMSEAAWIEQILITVGEDSFAKKYGEIGDKPEACELEEEVDNLLISILSDAKE